MRLDNIDSNAIFVDAQRHILSQSYTGYGYS